MVAVNSLDTGNIEAARIEADSVEAGRVDVGSVSLEANEFELVVKNSIRTPLLKAYNAEFENHVRVGTKKFSVSIDNEPTIAISAGKDHMVLRISDEPQIYVKEGEKVTDLWPPPSKPKNP